MLSAKSSLLGEVFLCLGGFASLFCIILAFYSKTILIGV